MPDPTSRDFANAALRQTVADRQRDEYRRVLAWADSIMGPGWLPHGRHYLLEIEEEEIARREGTTAKAAATVYTVTNGVRKRHFMVGEDGKAQEVAGYKEGFQEMLLEPHPTRLIEVRGEKVSPHRYSLNWAPIELYEPRTAEELAALRVSREKGKVEREERKWKEENPLLASAGIKPEDLKPERRR